MTENKASSLSLSLKTSNKPSSGSSLGGLGKGKAGKATIESFIPKKSHIEEFFSKHLTENPIPLTLEEAKNPQSYGPYIPRKTGANNIRDIDVDGVNFDQLFVYQE